MRITLVCLYHCVCGRHWFVCACAGDCVYRGYVDDPRNTDNAWMETVAQNFHEEEPGLLQQVSVYGGASWQMPCSAISVASQTW